MRTYVRFSTRPDHRPAPGRGRLTYEAIGLAEVDIFLVHCPQTDRVYAVPADETTMSDVALRVDPPGNRQVKGIRWAVDHELPA